MLIRNELIEPSISTFSFSFRLITIGVNKSSLLLLKLKENISEINLIVIMIMEAWILQVSCKVSEAQRASR